MKNRARHYRWLERSCYILIICLVVTALSAAQAQVSERLESPSGKYSIEVARAAKNSLVVSKGTEIVARISTQVGPVDSLFEALWSADGKYVAVNKQRSSRPGGDYMFILVCLRGRFLGSRMTRCGLNWKEKHRRSSMKSISPKLVARCS